MNCKSYVGISARGTARTLDVGHKPMFTGKLVFPGYLTSWLTIIIFSMECLRLVEFVEGPIEDGKVG